MEKLALPELNIKISNTLKMLENLKLLFEIPRLYISNYFSEIRKEIDIAVNEKLFKNSPTSNVILNENWGLIIEKLHSYETACLRNFPKNKFNNSITNETISFIGSLEQKLKSVTNQGHNESFTEEYFQSINIELNQLENEIYDVIVQLEKIAFENMCFIFIDQKMSKLDGCFGTMNKETTAGKLLIIKNEYFGQRGILRLKK